MGTTVVRTTDNRGNFPEVLGNIPVASQEEGYKAAGEGQAVEWQPEGPEDEMG